MNKKIMDIIKKRVFSFFIIFLIVISMFSIFLISPIVEADEGDLTFVGYHDGGNLSSGLRLTSGFFYSNASGAYIITCGGFSGGLGDGTDDVIRTDFETNTSIKLGNIPYARYKHCTVFDPSTRTFYIIGGDKFGGGRQDTIYAFCLDNDTSWNTSVMLPVSTTAMSFKGAWYNGIAWMFGGNSLVDEYEDDIFAFCPNNKTAWRETHIPSSVYSTGVQDPCVVYKGTGDIVALFGGETASGTYSDVMALYCFTNSTMWRTGTLSRGGSAWFHGCYNDVNDTYILSTSDQTSAGDCNNISRINPNDWVEIPFNNYTWTRRTMIVWDNRTNNKSAILFSNWDNLGVYHNDIYILDLNLVAESASLYTLIGLTDNNITWSGYTGNTVWCNSSGTNDWLEINMTINSTDNITEIRIWVGNLSDTGYFINASNISMYISSDNSNFGELGSFTDGGSNLSINSSNWNDGTMGTNPFSGQGLNDKIASVYCRFKLNIPNGIGGTVYYNMSSWIVYIGRYV